MGTPLDNARYINLETFKKSGAGVKTPVWSAPLDGKLVVFTAGDSWKVKRLRNNPKIRVTGCNGRGGVREGATWYEGTARVLDDGEGRRALRALRAKYGWQMYGADFFSAIVGRMKKRAYLELTVGA